MTIETECDGAREITPRYENLYIGGAPGPPEASDLRVDDGGGPCTVSDGAEVAAPPWSSCMTAF